MAGSQLQRLSLCSEETQIAAQRNSGKHPGKVMAVAPQAGGFFSEGHFSLSW
jgi:hypothetical protein